MRQSIDRLGILPFLLLGGGLFVLGLMATNHIANNFWPFDVARLDLVRGAALDTVDATSIMEAINTDIMLAFLAGVMVATTGLTLPIAYYANRRFGPEAGAPSFLIVVRQALLVGLWLAFCIWLQMNRSLGIAVATLVAVVLVLFEILLQVRTRASSVSSG
ncbi:MAG TPA: hypothetical protein VK879_20645 [Candidatus Sulfomarinibacteraceae bacterium]|nr:hypothetical protein [Candidatus Sulfomarinibacteraceae bacterium]